MAFEVVRYPARDGEGRVMSWVGVRRYYCPEGCSTAFYDFKKARLVGPAGAAGGRSAGLQAAAWFLTGLYVAVGLVLLYALFMYGASVIPVPAPWVRVLLWVLVTAGFAAIAFLLRPAARRHEGAAIPSGAPSLPQAGSDGAAQGAAAAAGTPHSLSAPRGTSTPR